MKNILSSKSGAANKPTATSLRAGRRTDGAPGSSLTQEAYEQIRADVLACRLLPGDRLNIASLTKQLPASLGAVREALSRLTAEGLVEAEPHRGFRVTPLSNDDLRDLTMTRIQVEGLCLRRSIEYGDVAWESAVVGAYHQLSRQNLRCKDDPQRLDERWVEAHRTFHQTLAGACDSAWLTRIRLMLYAQSERYQRLSVPLQDVPRDLDREHRLIMKAAVERDADRAVAALTKHLQQTLTILSSASDRIRRRKKA